MLIIEIHLSPFYPLYWDTDIILHDETLHDIMLHDRMLHGQNVTRQNVTDLIVDYPFKCYLPLEIL